MKRNVLVLGATVGLGTNARTSSQECIGIGKEGRAVIVIVIKAIIKYKINYIYIEVYRSS